jgi:hypothetical protein
MKLLENVTVASTSRPIYSSEMRDGNIALAVTGLSVGEEVVVEFSIDSINWNQVYQYGTAIKLTSTNNILGVYAPVNLRVRLTTNPINPVTVVAAQLSEGV